MNSISAIRPFVPPDLTQLNAMGPSAGSLKQQGGLSVAEFDKLASAVEVAPLSGGVESTGKAGEVAPTSFESVLKDMVREVKAKQAAATGSVAGVLSGDGTTLHEAMLASEEASLSFQLMVEVRNKVLDSYQELMRMQL